MDYEYVVPDYMEYSAGVGNSDSILVDTREDLVITLNSTGKLAWEALAHEGSWTAACAAFANSIDVDIDTGDSFLDSFMEKLSANGWITLIQK